MFVSFVNHIIYCFSNALMVEAGVMGGGDMVPEVLVSMAEVVVEEIAVELPATNGY